MLNTENFNVEVVRLVTAVNPFAPNGYGSNRSGNNKVGGEPNGLSYKGHGRTEKYPLNLNIAYVTGHERGHANHNRLSALARNEQVEQDVSYKITLTQKGPVAEGVTKLTKTKPLVAQNSALPNQRISGKGVHDFSRNLMDASFNELLLRNELSRLKRESSFPNQLHSPNVKEGSNVKQLPDKTYIGEKQNELKQKSGDNGKYAKIKKLEEQVQKIELSKGNELKDSNLEKANAITGEGEKNINKEDHIDLTRKGEMALQSHISSSTGIPSIGAIGYGSSFKFQGLANSIGRYNNVSIVSGQQSIDSDRLRAVSKFWSHLKTSLTSLREKTSQLTNFSNYSVNNVTSSNSSFVEVSTNPNAKAGQHTIVSSQLASFHVLESDQVVDENTALGLSGTFKVNESKITVTSTDTLINIRDKINYGEDSNKDGKLSGAEDYNGNGLIDTYVVGKENSRIYIREDSNNDGVLSSKEDVNGNNVLDGGTKEHNIVATIYDKRLVLNYRGNDSRHNVIVSGDSDGQSVLESLGFIERRLAKELDQQSYSNESAAFRYVNKNETKAQDSILTVDNKQYTRYNNEVTDVISNATIKLKEVSNVEQTIKVKDTAEKALNLVKDFVDGYNEVMNFLNSSMDNSGGSLALLRGNSSAAYVRQSLLGSVTGGNTPDNIVIEKLREIGLPVNVNSKEKVNTLVAQNISDKLEKAGANGFQPGATVVGISAGALTPVGSNSSFEALKAVNIGSASDGKIVFDKNELQKALLNNPGDIFNFFTDSQLGPATLVNDTLDVLLNKDNGTIANEENLLNQMLVRDPAANAPNEPDLGGFNQRQQNRFARNILSFFQGQSIYGTISNVITVTA
ncbi:MAG: flagellar filament capping protein FliD [Nitrospinae bacterium]|nr:flagellar filament capping protein FliD [Nitrospinota bacterium]